MQNIFPAGGGPQQGIPFGMPDLSAGQVDASGIISQIMRARQSEREDERNWQNRQETMRRSWQQPQLQNIGNQMQQQGPNVIYKPDPNSAIDQQVRNMLNPPIKEKELALRADIQAQKTGISQQNVNINQQKANIAKFKSENPGLKVIATKGGNVTFYNPMTGETQDSGVPTGTLTEKERIDLTGEQRMEEIGARGTETRKNQELRGQQRLGEIGASITGRKEIAEMQGQKPMLPTQQRVDQQNKVREITNTRPELAKFITTAPDGSFQVTPPGQTDFFGNPTGPSLAQFAEINKAVFGEKKPTTTPKSTTPAKAPAKTTTPKASKYAVTIE